MTLDRWSLALAAFTVLALLNAPNAIAQTKAPAVKAAEPKPMEYILEHLKRAQGKALATLPPDSGVSGYGLTFKEVKAVDGCSLAVHYDAFVFNTSVVVTRTEDIVLKFKDAELDSPKASGMLIEIRMMNPAKAVSNWIQIDVSGDDKSIQKRTETPSSTDRYEVSLPASDEEDAKRVARALNEQIRLCGGKADPFAK